MAVPSRICQEISDRKASECAKLIPDVEEVNSFKSVFQGKQSCV